MSKQNKVIAAAQVESVWLDLAGGVEKTKQLIKDAKAQGADVLGLPELWLPGYPWYLWTLPYGATVPYTLQYQANSMACDGPEMAAIQAACAESGITLSFGFSEKQGESLYMSNAIITADVSVQFASFEGKNNEPSH